MSQMKAELQSAFCMFVSWTLGISDKWNTFSACSCQSPVTVVTFFQLLFTVATSHDSPLYMHCQNRPLSRSLQKTGCQEPEVSCDVSSVLLLSLYKTTTMQAWHYSFSISLSPGRSLLTTWCSLRLNSAFYTLFIIMFYMTLQHGSLFVRSFPCHLFQPSKTIHNVCHSWLQFSSYFGNSIRCSSKLLHASVENMLVCRVLVCHSSSTFTNMHITTILSAPVYLGIFGIHHVRMEDVWIWKKTLMKRTTLYGWIRDYDQVLTKKCTNHFSFIGIFPWPK